MKKDILFINGKRDGYATNQCNTTLTVGELIEVLEGYNSDAKVYLRNDNGYTYGSVTEDDIYDSEESEEESEEEEE